MSNLLKQVSKNIQDSCTYFGMQIVQLNFMAMRLTMMATHEINPLRYERNARLPSNKIQFRAANEKLKANWFQQASLGA